MSETPASRRRWLVPLLAGGFLAAAFVLLDLPGDTRFWHSLQNSGHGLAFALLTAYTLFALRRDGRWSGRGGMALVALALFALGAAIELLQHLGGRDASARDLVMNAAGMLAGASLFLAVSADAAGPHRRASRRVWLALPGAAALLWCLRLPAAALLGGRAPRPRCRSSPISNRSARRRASPTRGRRSPSRPRPTAGRETARRCCEPPSPPDAGPVSDSSSRTRTGWATRVCVSRS